MLYGLLSCKNDDEKLNILLPVLLRIINYSLNSGSVPEEWRTSAILPLIKKEHSIEYNSYCPINNLTFISKMVEKCIVKQLMKYCNQCELFPSYLSAYRDHHSTEAILLKLVNDTLMNMVTQCITPLVSCDLSVAFDTVSHNILCNVFESCFSVKDTALSWFKDYLSRRSMQVQIRSTTKFPVKKHVECGVSQGSCCDPVLFNVYVSTLDDYITDVNKLRYTQMIMIYTQVSMQIIGMKSITP